MRASRGRPSVLLRVLEWPMHACPLKPSEVVRVPLRVATSRVKGWSTPWMPERSENFCEFTCFASSKALVWAIRFSDNSNSCPSSTFRWSDSLSATKSFSFWAWPASISVIDRSWAPCSSSRADRCWEAKSLTVSSSVEVWRSDAETMSAACCSFRDASRARWDSSFSPIWREWSALTRSTAAMWEADSAARRMARACSISGPICSIALSCSARSWESPVACSFSFSSSNCWCWFLRAVSASSLETARDRRASSCSACFVERISSRSAVKRCRVASCSSCVRESAERWSEMVESSTRWCSVKKKGLD